METGFLRTLVDIPESHLEALDKLASERKVSRASLIRDAVGDLLKNEKSDIARDAFGLWGGEVDGLAFERKLRQEW